MMVSVTPGMEGIWPVRSALPALATDGIHVWLASLTPSGEQLAEWAATLATDERERAARFRFPAHRDRFIAGRGLLRAVLGAYLGRPAAALRFEQGPHGKPALAGEDAGAGVHFNLSHSGDRALYAVADRVVGIDLEGWDRTMDSAAIAERICTPREWALFQALPAERLREAFFACWTRKEAIAKALGSGLAGGLRNLDVCFREDQSRDGRTHLRDATNREWSVLNLPLDPGWAGALAATERDWWWRGWRWI